MRCGLKWMLPSCSASKNSGVQKFGVSTLSLTRDIDKYLKQAKWEKESLLLVVASCLCASTTSNKLSFSHFGRFRYLSISRVTDKGEQQIFVPPVFFDAEHDGSIYFNPQRTGFAV